MYFSCQSRSPPVFHINAHAKNSCLYLIHSKIELSVFDKYSHSKQTLSILTTIKLMAESKHYQHSKKAGVGFLYKAVIQCKSCVPVFSHNNKQNIVRPRKLSIKIIFSFFVKNNNFSFSKSLVIKGGPDQDITGCCES